MHTSKYLALTEWTAQGNLHTKLEADAFLITHLDTQLIIPPNWAIFRQLKNRALKSHYVHMFLH